MRHLSRVWKALALIVVLAALVVGFSRDSAAAICGNYNNSSRQYAGGYGFYCGATGGTCSECTFSWSGGYTVCVGDSENPPWCIDYQY